MGKKLVIVESPAKAKTINKILGSDYLVKSSVGHVRDLPERQLGVEVRNAFKPKYVILKGKKKVVDELRKAAEACDEIYLAPDPDREGEAIAWHLQALLQAGNKDKPFLRVRYNEITPSAVRDAFAHPGTIDMKRVDAQQARRVLDRIVGYMVSPILWRRLRRGLSAGRVQSVALRLICEREEEIRRFVPEQYWVLGARVRKLVDPLDPFQLKLVKIDGEKADVRTAERAASIRADLEGRKLRVAEVALREVSRRPYAPFITSTLQQAASSQCSFSPSRTMSIAQSLYEGVDLGDGPVGLITYMRTDSFDVAREAVQACREFIGAQFGPEYCPEQPNVYRSRASAQGAHEAIRPTDLHRVPESLRSRLDPTQFRLYELIWKRFVASQMTPAVLLQRTVRVETLPEAERPATYLLQAGDSQVKFPGFMKVSGVDAHVERRRDKDEEAEEETAERIPPLAQGEPLECLEWLMDQKQTQPPPRFTEPALIAALESNGIGRPSTYAQILATLIARKYASREKRTLFPTEIGMQVSQLLVASLGELFNVAFTASMEKSLDEVEEGAVDWTAMLAKFFGQFEVWLEAAKPPAADEEKVRKILTAFESVREWAPEVKRGKRTYSDRGFADSIRAQLTEGRGAATQRQLDALVRIAGRYREQAPEIAAMLDELGVSAQAEAARPADGPPLPSTVRKLELLKSVQLTESIARFVDSLRTRVEQGRGLSEAQGRALDNVVRAQAPKIEGFEALRAELELSEAAPPTTNDTESQPMLAALAHVKEWREPVARGRRVFDDKAFHASLAGQFERKKYLSDKQRAALKKLVKKYRDQIPEAALPAETPPGAPVPAAPDAAAAPAAPAAPAAAPEGGEAGA